MTQPRKEQIRNLKAKYTRVNAVGTLSSFGWNTLASNSGAFVQELVDSSGDERYTDFISASVTQVTGGAEVPCPPVLYGGNGPFTVVNGTSFSITVPGVNAGNPFTVTIQSTDLVTLGGSQVLTTSRAANMINAAFATQGVTYPVARNQDGQLVLVAADAAGVILGDDAFITLTDVTAGVLAAMGFVSTPASATGVSGPKRGIVTHSADGLGGTAFLKHIDGSPAYAPVRKLYHVGGWRYVEDAPIAHPVYARLREVPVSSTVNKLRLNYLRKGVVQARLTANGGNVSTLGGSDTFTVTVAGPDTGTQVLAVTFTGGATTIADVVDEFNAAWANETLSSGGVEATRAAVLCSPGPYAFTGAESMVIAFNGTANITITPAATDKSATDLAATINAAIATASLTAQGEAVVTTPAGGAPTLQIRSKSVDPATSSLKIAAGAGTPPDLRVLKQLNLSVGTYVGTSVVKAYGADELRFVNPARGLGHALTITSNGLSMGRLGFANSTETTAATAADEEVGAPECHLLLPEVMEFGEVPDDYDRRLEEWSSTALPQIRPEGGMNNAALSALLGPNGLLKDVLAHLPYLNTDTAVLGSRLTANAASQLIPRVSAGYNAATSGVLLQEITDLQGSANKIRVYVIGGELVFTVNAKLATAGTWSKDTNGVRATKLVVGANSGVTWRPAASNAAWADTDWETGTRTLADGSTVTIDDGGFPDQTFFIDVGTSTTTINLINPALCRGREFWVIALSGASPASLALFGSESINGQPTNYSMTTPNGRWRVTSDGTDWYVFEDAQTAVVAANIAIANLSRQRTLTTTATINTPDRDATIVLNPVSSFNLTLPSAGSAEGQRIFLLNGTGTMSDSNKVTLVRTGGALINNLAQDFDLEAAYGRWWLFSDGTNWHIAQT